jgi:hypothetical protein
MLVKMPFESLFNDTHMRITLTEAGLWRNQTQIQLAGRLTAATSNQ